MNLSAAFNTVDCKILLDRLEKWVGLCGTVLNWFKLYLQDRDYFVSIGNYEYEQTKFTSYHTYADDTQLYITVTSVPYIC